MAPLTRAVLLLALLAAAGMKGAGQDSSTPPEEDFRVYADHPRLFLRPQRLHLLKRERQRESMRWNQFEALVRGGAPLREPGFALALYYAVAGDKAAGQKAVEFAMASSDLRQLALVFDWCQDLLNDAQRRRLVSRIQRLSAAPAREDPDAVRDRVLAAISIADEDRDRCERTLGDIVRHWWRGGLAPRLASGDLIIAHARLYPVEEILHAIRDNLRIELRENAGDYFNRLPAYELASYYPAPLQGAGNDLWIPASAGGGEPDQRQAILSRVADLSLVAYDSNALGSQYVQGWVMQDRFMLRDTLGAPYEFLWGNPYQPGLSYYQLPLACHDAVSGALFVRSSWDDDAAWFGLVGSQMQVFEHGRASVVRDEKNPIEIGGVEILPGRPPLAFETSGGTMYVVGLPPRKPFLVEADDEEMDVADTDRGGTLALQFAGDRKRRVLIHEEAATY